jgi:hypothetical protein
MKTQPRQTITSNGSIPSLGTCFKGLERQSRTTQAVRM